MTRPILLEHQITERDVCARCGCSVGAILHFNSKCKSEAPKSSGERQWSSAWNQGRYKSPPEPEADFEERDHARVLGLRGRVTLGDIKRLYRQRMKEYHPDKVHSLGSKLRELAETETKRINAALDYFEAKYGKNGEA